MDLHFLFLPNRHHQLLPPITSHPVWCVKFKPVSVQIPPLKKPLIQIQTPGLLRMLRSLGRPLCERGRPLLVVQPTAHSMRQIIPSFSLGTMWELLSAESISAHLRLKRHNCISLSLVIPTQTQTSPVSQQVNWLLNRSVLHDNIDTSLMQNLQACD